MDRLIQGVDEESGQPFVLFGKVRIQTLSDGWRVLDERDGSIKQFADRTQALRAAGLAPEAVEQVASLTPEQPYVLVRALISEVEAKALQRIADRLELTPEAAARRAIASWVIANDTEDGSDG